MFDTKFAGLKGGSDATFFEVLAEGEGEYVDYPAIKDGQPVKYPMMGTRAEIEDYWKHKTERKRPAVVLAVAGNAVSCESTIKDMGFGAFAAGVSTVYVFKSDPGAVESGRRGGSAKSEAKTAASRANGARGGRPKKKTE